MERGLLWLPLLAVFIGLAWAGWREFQKVEAYQRWAQDFERAKYDILAVIGMAGSTLTWGIPTRHGPQNLQSFDLHQVQQVELWHSGQPLDPARSPATGKQYSLRFTLLDRSVDIPFTDGAIAQAWYEYLQGYLASLPSTTSEGIS